MFLSTRLHALDASAAVLKHVLEFRFSTSLWLPQGAVPRPAPCAFRMSRVESGIAADDEDLLPEGNNAAIVFCEVVDLPILPFPQNAIGRRLAIMRSFALNHRGCSQHECRRPTPLHKYDFKTRAKLLE